MTRPAWGFFLLLFALLPLGGSAQTPTTAGSPQAPATNPPQENGVRPTGQPAEAKNDSDKKNVRAGGEQEGGKVAKIITVRAGTATNLGSDVAKTPVYLGDWLTFEVENLDELTASKKPLQLYLNGMPLQGEEPVYMKENGKILLRFPLLRSEESKDTWSALLGRPGIQERPVKVSVGVTGCAEGCTNTTDAVPIRLVVLRRYWLLGFVIAVALFLFILLRLARATSLLHDRGLKSPWSLGRVQMAWWFVFVASSFVYIWIVTGSYSNLSNSVLALIGISAATALFGAVIDDNKRAQMVEREALEAEKLQLETANRGLAANDPAFLVNNQRVQEMNGKLAQLPAEQKASGHFWQDILSDDHGVSFHRFQIVIWTLVLTLIFVVRIHTHLAMPDFDSQLLALMGISSGAYLGFKFPEKKA